MALCFTGQIYIIHISPKDKLSKLIQASIKSDLFVFTIQLEGSDDESGSEEEEGAGVKEKKEDKSGVYVPPKLAAVHYGKIIKH